MSRPSRRITPATSLENLRKEAKRWLKALRDVQHALAREYDHAGWRVRMKYTT